MSTLIKKENILPTPNYKVIYFKKENCIFIYAPYLNEIHFIIKINDKHKIQYKYEELAKDKFISSILEQKSIDIEHHMMYTTYTIINKYYIHYINEYDENLNINVLENSTLLSMNMFVNGFYINIYKKVINRKDSNYIKNITSNFIKFRSKALDEISKMNEFIYNNYDFIYNLIKFKMMFLYTADGFNRCKINNAIQINVNEINQFYKIMELVKHDCNDSTPSGYFDFLNGEISLYNKKMYINHNLPVNHHGIFSKLSCFLKHSNHSILNKQNFEKIQNFEIPFKNIGITNNTYISPDKTLFISDNSKIINFNKKFNYYYDKNITGFEKIKIFNHKIIKNGITIYNKIMKPKVNFNNEILNKKSYINSFTKINNIMYLYSTTPLTDNFESDINKNINNLLNKLNIFNKFKSYQTYYPIEFILLIILHTIKEISSIKYLSTIANIKNKKGKSQFVNVSKIDQIETAINNINSNYNNKDEILITFNNIINNSHIQNISNKLLYLTPTVRIHVSKIENPLLRKFLLKLQLELNSIKYLYQNKNNNFKDEIPLSILIEILVLMKTKYTEKFLSKIRNIINEDILRLL